MIAMQTYANRRQQLIQKVKETTSQQATQTIIIVPAGSLCYRNADTAYPFRQQSDFYYLTGFAEPDALLVLLINANDTQAMLFNRPRDPVMEQWDGPRVGQEEACTRFLFDQAYPYAEFETRLSALLTGVASVYYPIGRDALLDRCLSRSLNALRAKVRGGVLVPHQFVDILPFIHEMRLFKDQEELALMQQAIDITAYGHISAMKACRPRMYEYELEALLSYAFTQHGARAHAYAPIVGAGANGCVLHYIANNQIMQAGDLVLIDAGAEYHCYAADVTRTFPVNGRFSAEQKAIYELVLASQKAAIETIKPGAAWPDAQQAIVNVLTQGLLDLGILRGTLTEHVEKQSYLPFYMHKSGHWLGLDVHDMGAYRCGDTWRTLRPNMVLTVEPGLYLSATIKDLPARWHNIGVRIEDDVRVTEEGAIIMSAAIPKEIADIEAVMQQ